MALHGNESICIQSLIVVYYVVYYPPSNHCVFVYYEVIPSSVHLSQQWHHYPNLPRTLPFPFEGHLMLDPQNHRLRDNDTADLLHRERLS